MLFKRVYEKDPEMPLLKEQRIELELTIQRKLDKNEDAALDMKALAEIRNKQEKRFKGILVDYQLPGTVKGTKKPITHQNFPTQTVARGKAEGWIQIDGDTLKVVGLDKTLEFKIVRTPGHYCCHCNEYTMDSKSSQVHVDAAHRGEKSPDGNNPAGYRRDHFFHCVPK